MAMSKASLENAIRNEILDAVRTFLEERYDSDVMAVSANEIVMPVTDSEGNEKYALIKVSIPRGAREGGSYRPYNGYDAAQEYAEAKQMQEEKAAARKAAAEAKEQERERKRAARRIVQDLNTVGFKALVSQPPEETGTIEGE